MTDPGIATSTILSAVNGVAAWYDPDGRLPAERIADHLVDLVLRMLLFYACFVPLERAWWWDARRARRMGTAPEPFPAWPLRCMQVNFLLIYVLSLPNKLADDVGWLNGDAVYWSVANSTWGRWPWPNLFYDYGAALSYGTIVVEGLVPWLVWLRPTRRWAMAGGIGLHLGIVVLLQNVAFFSVAMMVGWLLWS